MSDFQIIIWSLIFSGLFSGLEIAFVSANKLRMEVEKKSSSHPWLFSIYKYPSKFISTLLLGNNISLVIYGFAAAKILRQPIINNLGSLGGNEFLILLIQTIASTFVILIISEFIPKALFSINPNKTLRFFTIPIFIIYYLFKPIVGFVNWLATGILKTFFGLKIENESSQLNSIELKDLVQDIDEEDDDTVMIGEEEKEIFKNVIDFKTIKIRECLIPRTDISAVEINKDIRILKNLFISTGHSKILIYSENIDNIIGYVHSFDLFRNPENIEAVLRKIIFIPETMMAHLVLSMFINSNKSIAVVLDEFGGTSGLVSMEDIIEEIFGEIEDEHDKGKLVDKVLKENVFLFSGRVEIDHINTKYHLKLADSEEYETLAGYIIVNNGDIPAKGDKITIRDHIFTIVKASENRVELIKMEQIPH